MDGWMPVIIVIMYIYCVYIMGYIVQEEIFVLFIIVGMQGKVTVLLKLKQGQTVQLEVNQNMTINDIIQHFSDQNIIFHNLHKSDLIVKDLKNSPLILDQKLFTVSGSPKIISIDWKYSQQAPTNQKQNEASQFVGSQQVYRQLGLCLLQDNNNNRSELFQKLLDTDKIKNKVQIFVQRLYHHIGLIQQERRKYKNKEKQQQRIKVSSLEKQIISMNQILEMLASENSSVLRLSKYQSILSNQSYEKIKRLQQKLHPLDKQQQKKNKNQQHEQKHQQHQKENQNNKNSQNNTKINQKIQPAIQQVIDH